MTGAERRAIPPSYADATHIDGPELAKWIDSLGISDLYAKHPNLYRRLYDWRRGSRVRIAAAEDWVMKLGYTLHDLPDTVWRRGMKTSQSQTAEARAQAGDLFDKKWNNSAIASKLGCNRSTVIAWRTRYRNGDELT